MGFVGLCWAFSMSLTILWDVASILQGFSLLVRVVFMSCEACLGVFRFWASGS